MDSQGEASGNRILTARHIADKTFPEMNESVNSLNTTVLCHSLTVNPDFATYYSALQPYTWALWSSGLVVFFLVCVLFVLTLRNARAHWRESGSSLIIVLGVYPLVSAAGLVVLLVPRARLLAEAAAQQTVMLGLYHLFSLLIAEAGGEDKLISKAGGTRLETRVLPCCCWPCCFIPRPALDKRVLTWLRCLVLQLPVVQGLIYAIMLVLWAEDMELYARSFIFLQPFVVASILTGVWGIIMCVRLVEAAGLACKPRFLALQLAMLVVKLQCGAAKVVPEVLTVGCALPLNPTTVVHMIQYSIMMVEMLLLSLWAWRLYRTPPSQEKIQHVVVAVLEDGQSKSGDWTQRDTKYM